MNPDFTTRLESTWIIARCGSGSFSTNQVGCLVDEKHAWCNICKPYLGSCNIRMGGGYSKACTESPDSETVVTILTKDASAMAINGVRNLEGFNISIQDNSSDIGNT